MAPIKTSTKLLQFVSAEELSDCNMQRSVTKDVL